MPPYCFALSGLCGLLFNSGFPEFLKLVVKSFLNDLAYFRCFIAVAIWVRVHSCSSAHVLNLKTPLGNQRPHKGLSLNMELFHCNAAFGPNGRGQPTTFGGRSSQPSPSSRTIHGFGFTGVPSGAGIKTVGCRLLGISCIIACFISTPFLKF
jgi:hypothetical protein